MANMLFLIEIKDFVIDLIQPDAAAVAARLASLEAACSSECRHGNHLCRLRRLPVLRL